MAGFRVEFDLSLPPFERLQSVSILCTECRVPRYEPLDDKKVYKLAMPSYIADGGDGYSMIKDEKLKHDSGKFGSQKGEVGLLFLQFCRVQTVS